MTIPSSELYIRYILTYQPKLLMPRPQFNLRKVACPLELIKQVMNVRERILVFYCDLDKFTIINEHPNQPIFLLNKQHRSFPWEILGLMKLLSSKFLC